MKTILSAFAAAVVITMSTTALAQTSGTGDSSAAVGTSITVKGNLTFDAKSGIVGQSFVLDGTKSQDDATALRYHKWQWRQVSGPVVSLSNASSEKPTFSPTVAGTYVFELVATDDTGLSSVVQKSEYIVQHNETNLEFIKKGSESSIGDPDFDLLNISIGDDDLDAFRAEVSAAGETQKVTVRGWDPKKKEEIVARPQDVKTPDDLKRYVEAIALNDYAIKEITFDNGIVVMKSREPVKLLGFIPVEIISNVIITFDLRDSSSDLSKIDVRFSWWHVFAKKVFTSEMLWAELSVGMPAPEEKTNPNAPITMGSIARILQSVSNVLKTKHDTAKNSISNIR